MRAGCFPKPSGGCRCTEKNAEGKEATVNHDSMADCGEQHAPASIDAKKEVNKELKEKSAGLKENCYPRPGSGCRCVEKAGNGTEVTKQYDTEAECKAKTRRKRDDDRDRSRSQSPSDRSRSQSPSDPVREKAAQNYQAVLNELKDKFRGLKGNETRTNIPSNSLHFRGMLSETQGLSMCHWKRSRRTGSN